MADDKSNDLEKKNLFTAANDGTKDFFQWNSENSPLPNSAYEEKKDFIYYCFGIDYAPCNGIFEKSKRTIAQKEVQEAIKFFTDRQLPFIWWTDDKNLENQGFQFGGILTGIAMDISKELPTFKLSNVQIKIVHTEEELKKFSDVVIKGFGIPESTLEQFHAVFEVGMKTGEQLHFLVFVDNVPVASATLSISGKTAGIWNLATIEGYRKQGIGQAVVHAALTEAKKRNYHYAMAVLMPKGMAWGLFTKLGFEKVCDYPFYVYGVSPEDLEK